jgi:ribonuclease HI
MFICYCDGSSTGRIGRAGACAIVFFQGKGVLVARPLAFDTGNNVSELAAVYICLQELPPKSTAIIYTDSKNCIMWLTDKFRRNNPQIEDVYKRIKKVWREKELTITFEWIAGHSGNKWNEICDLAAKQAKETGKTIRKEVYE